ncbi:hypothetical protein AOLI_G00265310 [Acnodon oligacanthus]
MRGLGVSNSVCRRWKSAACAIIFLASLLLLVFTVLLQLGVHKVTRRSVPTNNNMTASTSSQVRLVNGRSRCEGRVEVQHNGTWGTVCDDDWDMVDANVYLSILGNSVIGPRGSPEEPTTPSRRNSGLRDGTIRLMGGPDHCQGRVEIYYRGSWGTVCDDDWGMRDAVVVCQQVGCGPVVTYTTNAYFGYGTGLIMLDNVNCNGHESQLASCYSLGWGIHNCGHHEDAGVICKGLGTTTAPPLDMETMGRAFFHTESTAETGVTVPVTDTTAAEPTTAITTREQPSVRVVNGNSSCQGRVEVSYNSIWGTVCDDDWDMDNAQVVCRQLGCGPALAAVPLAYFGYGSGPILLDNVDCQGNERALADCFNLGWGQHNCGHHEDAGVICSTFQPLAGTSRSFGMTERTVTTPAPVEGAIRLSGGQHRCEGRVELYQSGEWGLGGGRGT